MQEKKAKPGQCYKYIAFIINIFISAIGITLFIFALKYHKGMKKYLELNNKSVDDHTDIVLGAQAVSCWTWLGSSSGYHSDQKDSLSDLKDKIDKNSSYCDSGKWGDVKYAECQYYKNYEILYYLAISGSIVVVLLHIVSVCFIRKGHLLYMEELKKQIENMTDAKDKNIVNKIMAYQGLPIYKMYKEKAKKLHQYSPQGSQDSSPVADKLDTEKKDEIKNEK